MTVPYTFGNESSPIPLSQLDANFATTPAYANTAGNVINSNQANITSVGTLTSLSVAGGINAGNIYTASGISAVGTVTASSFTTNGTISAFGTVTGGALDTAGAVTANTITADTITAETTITGGNKIGRAHV